MSGFPGLPQLIDKWRKQAARITTYGAGMNKESEILTRCAQELEDAASRIVMSLDYHSSTYRYHYSEVTEKAVSWSHIRAFLGESA